LKNRNIFFPIEIIKRELDYKMILACMVLEENQRAVIAQHDRIEQFMLKSFNGVYIGKNVMNKPDKNNDKYAIFNKIKKNNFSIIHLDEEGGIYAGGDQRIRDMLDERLDVNVLNSDDLVCTWGEFQCKHYKTRLGNNIGPKIVNTGYIKFELTKSKYFGLYDDKKKEYKKKYGPYILINSHWSFANNAYGISDTFSLRNGYGPSFKEKIRLTEVWGDEQIKIAYFVSLAHSLSEKFPKLNFIFRPHPAEDFNYYKNIFNELDNVIVINEGEVVPWLLGAKCMIHDRCTTSVEAHLMNIPVINYVVNDNQDHESSIAKRIGTKCKTDEEVIDCVNNILKENSGYKGINSFRDFGLDLLDNLNEDISNDIVSYIKGVVKSKSNKKTVALSIFRIFFTEFIYSIFLFLKYPIRILFYKQKQKYYVADTGAFPGFNKKEIESRLKIISRAFNQKFNLKFFSKRVFIIEKK